MGNTTVFFLVTMEISRYNFLQNIYNLKVLFYTLWHTYKEHIKR